MSSDSEYSESESVKERKHENYRLKQKKLRNIHNLVTSLQLELEGKQHSTETTLLLQLAECFLDSQSYCDYFKYDNDTSNSILANPKISWVRANQMVSKAEMKTPQRQAPRECNGPPTIANVQFTGSYPVRREKLCWYGEKCNKELCRFKH